MEGHNHGHHKVGRGKRAAVVPGDGIEQVIGIDHHALDIGRLGCAKFLVGGDPGLAGGVPVYPGIARHFDGVGKGERHPIVALADDQAGLGRHRGAFEALR